MKNFTVTFGSGDPRNLTGLAPTFLIFVRSDTGATIAPPSITEIATGWGLYTFQWGVTTPISFLIDAATTSPGPIGRFVSGAIDPADRIDEIGITVTAISNTLLVTAVGIGSTTSSFGTSSTDPVDLYGYMKRILENLEGDQQYQKPNGVFQIYNRGSTTLLRQKTIANSVSLVTRT